MAIIVGIKFKSGNKIYYFDPAGKEYATGDHLIIDTARGAEYGICTAGLFIGRRFGTALADKASIFGGCILIFIGLEIFITSLF